MFKLKIMLVVMTIAGFLLVACSGGKAQTPVEVQITLTEFGIKSSLAEFETDVPYTFVVTNAGMVEHEFMIMPPLTQDQMGMHVNMTELDNMALAMIEAADLQAGGTASFDLTFTKPASSGELEFACHTPGHYEANMKLPIVVR